MGYKSFKKATFLLLLFMLTFMNTSTLFARISLQYDGATHEYTEAPFKFYVDGKLLTDLPVEPVRINDRFYVPVRAFFEQLGADVQWFPDSQQILVVNNTDMVLMQIDSLEYTVNTQTLTLNKGEAPKLVNYQGEPSASTMVPVRMVSEGLGYNVIYDGVNRIISINSSTTIPITPEIPVTETPITETPITVPPITDNTGGNTSNPTIVNGFVLPMNRSSSPLVATTAPQTTLSSVNYNEPSSTNNYTESVTLNTTSEISKVSELVLEDGRLVLDFSNTIFNISNPKLTATNTSSFTATNGSQFEKIPSPTARFVLNLKSGVEYSLSMSADRKSLTVTFLKGQLTNFDFNNNTLSILGTKSFQVSSLVLSDPLRLVIDIPNMIVDTTNISDAYNLSVNSDAVSNIRISQFTPNQARFVLDMSKDFSYTTEYILNGVKIKITPMEDYPAYYSYTENKFIIDKDSLSNSISIDTISKVENVTYKTKEYTFTLNATIPEIGSSFEKAVSSGIFDSYTFTNNGSTSQLFIKLKEAKTFVITEDYEHIYFTPKAPGDVYDKVIVIDPGHGGTDVGTTLDGLHEKDIVLDIGKQVEAMLNASGENIKVYMSRNIDEKIPLFDIPVFTEEINPDMFVSIHVNSAGSITAANGTETYYYTKQSSDLASIVHKNMLATMGTNDRKVKTNNYVVIRETDIPSILIETAFITNPDDNLKLRSAQWRTNTAQGITNGIIEAFDIYN